MLSSSFLTNALQKKKNLWTVPYFATLPKKKQSSRAMFMFRKYPLAYSQRLEIA